MKDHVCSILREQNALKVILATFKKMYGKGDNGKEDNDTRVFNFFLKFDKQIKFSSLSHIVLFLWLIHCYISEIKTVAVD